jgi:hypothetical protein
VIATMAERIDTRSTGDHGTRLCVWFRNGPTVVTPPN